MPLSRGNSAGSILTILSCDSDRFSEFYDGPLSTGHLVEAAKEVISHNQEILQKSQDRCRLDKLLLGMLDDAPDPNGTRYVAVVLHIANEKGSEAVLEAARAWLDYLYLPMLALSKATKTMPSSSRTPTNDSKALEIVSATRSDQADFRAAVAAREQYRCAITSFLDLGRVTHLINQGKGHEVPDSELPQVLMEAAYIIPFSLNKFDESQSLKEAIYTWDMLRAWTGVDVHQLVGSKINSPENGIYMNDSDHTKFGRFLFYFEKYPGLPIKYQVKMAQPCYRLGNGKVTADAEFLEIPGVPPPNPEFLKIHAAFAKVLARSKAALYMERVEVGNQRGAPTDPKGNDFATLLRSKLLTSAP